MNAQAGHQAATIDPRILKEAAAWLTQFHAGDISESQRAEWQRWKESSPQHSQAWGRAEQLLGRISLIPPQFSPALDRPPSPARRQVFKAMAATALVGPLAWLGYRMVGQYGSLSYSTGVGERRTVALADGVSLMLNTDSVVQVDYSEQRRQLRLVQGEIFINTMLAQAAPRLDIHPLSVLTDDGWLRMRDCRCNLRRTDARSEVTVVAGALELGVADGSAQLQLGSLQHASFTRRQISRSKAVTDPGAWMDGAIDADNMRLADFIEELGRYRKGVLHCDPAIADLRISGLFQVADTDKVLATLQNTLPIKVVFRSAYWVIVAPRPTPLRT